MPEAKPKVDYVERARQRRLAAQKQAAQNPPTPLTGMAHLRGPSATGEAGAAENMAPPPELDEKGFLAHSAELAGSLALAPVGGAAAGAIARRVLPEVAPPMIAGAARLAGRVLGSGAGAVGGSELAAPEDETPEQASARRQEAFSQGAAGEAIGLTGLGAYRAYRAFRRARPGHFDPSPFEMGAQEVQDLLREHDSTLTAGRALTAFTVRALDNIAAASYGGGRIMARTVAHGEHAALRAFDEASPQVANILTPDEVSVLLQDALTNGSEAHRRATRAAYRALDQAVDRAAHQPGITAPGGLTELGRYTHPVDLSNMRAEFLADERFQAMIVAGDKKALAVQRSLRALPEQMFDEQGRQIPFYVSFNMADAIRGVLGAMGRSDPDLIPGVATRALEFSRRIEQEMEAAMLRVGPLGEEVVSRWNVARATSRLSKEVFNHVSIRDLVRRADTQKITEAVFANNSPDVVRRLRQVIFNPDYREAIMAGDAVAGRTPEQLWGNVQASFLAEMRRRAGERRFHSFSGREIGEAFSASGGTFRELFPDAAQRGRLELSAQAMEMLQGATHGSRTGTATVNILQAGALVRGLQFSLGAGVAAEGYRSGRSGTDIAANVGLVMTAPWAIARVLSSPTIVSWMMKRAAEAEGRRGTRTTAALGQLIAHMQDLHVPFTWTGPDGVSHDVEPAPLPAWTPESETKSRESQVPRSKITAPPVR